MCGICGFSEAAAGDSESVLTAMNNCMRLRGPDSHGVWFDSGQGLALGHRRLSILDLSPEGHQPMLSRSGRYVIVFNGEIYNFDDLRKELLEKGQQFRGTSDTEVMLAGFEEWGILEALKRFVGMFAFAVWDRELRRLFLARDRIGEKPLYFGWSGGLFLFASELKAMRAHPRFDAAVNRDALALLMRHNYIPAPWSIYRGIYKLLPGSMLELNADQLRHGGDFSPWPEDVSRGLRPQRFWSGLEICRASQQDAFEGGEKEAVDELDRILRRAVRQQMVADVPLGAFLSGGIDSSMIVALMQAQSGRPVRTFSIGFHEGSYDEAPFAREVARHLGTDHTELYAQPGDALNVIPQLPLIYDEPFSDSSQIPTFLVSKLARQHVTVSLSGDGGDELFGGYLRFVWANRLWSTIGRAPRLLRQPIAAALLLPSEAQWDRIFAAAGGLLPDNVRFRNPGHKIRRLGEVLRCSRGEDLYHKLLSHWEDTDRIVPGSTEPPTVLTDERHWPADTDFLRRIMYLDLLSYLPDDIMVKVDRASMGVSLESRAPFLDHRVVEFVWKLPANMKIRAGETKWILRQLLDRYVPRQLIERPKMGFGVPIDSWLRGPLREWAEDLLSEERLRSDGFFDPVPVRSRWSEHLSGKKNRAYDLWDVLMFQSWLQSARTH